MTTLKRVASLRAGGTPSVDDPNMWSESEDDGVPWVSIGDMSDGKPVSATARRVSERGVESKRLPIGQPGTLLFAMYASVGAVGRLATRATWNQALLGIAPRPGLSDERFIRYWLEHLRPSLGGLTRSNTQDNLNAEQVGNFPFPDMPLAEQRAIADYLDAETARIDALIAKKQQLIHLLEERRWRTFDELAAEGASDLVPLRRMLTFLTDGPFGSAFSSADYVDSGMAVIRLGNIGFAEFRGDELVYLPLERQPEFTRYRVREGDLLAAALGDERNHAGRACVAPDLGPAIVKGKCFCGRVDGRVADPEYVALACSSPSAAERFRLGAQGSTRQMINLEIFKSLRVPLPSVDQQRRIVADTRDAWRILDGTVATLTRHIGLLAERRRALVTAAVTGDLGAPHSA